VQLIVGLQTPESNSYPSWHFKQSFSGPVHVKQYDYYLHFRHCNVELSKYSPSILQASTHSN